MNDLTLTAIAGILVSVISFLAYKLGQAKEERANTKRESEAVLSSFPLRFF